MIHISLTAEPIFTIGSFTITNSLFTTYVVMAILIVFVLLFSRTIRMAGPSKLQLILESVIGGFRGLCEDVAGSKNGREFFPYVMAFFIFIITLNWFGLIPGVGPIGVAQDVPAPIRTEIQNVEENTSGEQATTEQAEATPQETEHGAEELAPLFRAGTADLNTTLAFALISVILTQIYGIKKLGWGKHLKKYFNLSSPIMLYVGILELIGEFSRILSFSFRLFGNIFAGEVLLVVITFLIPFFVPIPFYGLEIFVGFIQALVFAMLTLVFLAAAAEHHE